MLEHESQSTAKEGFKIVALFVGFLNNRSKGNIFWWSKFSSGSFNDAQD